MKVLTTSKITVTLNQWFNISTTFNGRTAFLVQLNQEELKELKKVIEQALEENPEINFVWK